MTAPWDSAAVAEGLHLGWTTDPVNIADAERLATAVNVEAETGAVLDYGCGTGRLAAYFSPARYLGHDTSEAMLAVARREFPRHRFAGSLPPGRRFAAAVCNSVAQYLPDGTREDALRDICRRAQRVALIETYDGPHRDGEDGSDARTYIRTAAGYLEVLREFGEVERRVLAPDPRGALALYVVRR